jgi:hypothetical protein
MGYCCLTGEGLFLLANLCVLLNYFSQLGVSKLNMLGYFVADYSLTVVTFLQFELFVGELDSKTPLVN